MIQAMRSPQCSPGEVNRLYRQAKEAYNVRNSMDETIGRLKETIDQNEQYINLRDETAKPRTYANYKYDPRLADPWGLKKGIVSMFPEFVSNTFRKIFSGSGPPSLAKLGGGSLAPYQADLQDGGSLAAAGQVGTPQEAAGPTGVESSAQQQHRRTRGSSEQISESEAAMQDRNMITLEVHNQLKSAKGDDEKLRELDSKYGAQNPYRKRLENVGGLVEDEADQDVRVQRDPTITSASGPTLFEKVRIRYKSIFY